MSVLIEGMEMPKLYETYKVRFVEDGIDKTIVGIADLDSTVYRPIGEAIEVHDGHGRLIDADELRASFKESIDECRKWMNELNIETSMYVAARQALGTFIECSLRTKGMPTVIEAESYSERELQRDYERSVEMAEYCERYEPTYDPDTGAL